MNRILEYALIVAGINEEYQTSVIEGIVEFAHEHKVNISCFSAFGGVVSGRGFDVGEYSIYDLINYKLFDGIILMLNTIASRSAKQKIVDDVRKSGLPVIVFDCSQYPDFYNITIDNVKAMEELTHHVIEKHGAKRIAYVSGPESNPEAMERLDAFNRVRNSFGIADSDCTIYYGDFRPSEGRNAIIKILSDNSGLPDAVICANDAMALSAIKELRAHGYNVPEDLIVTGFDNIFNARYHYPSLTTVSRPLRRAGKKACQLLKDILDGKTVEKTYTFDAKFLLSESCGCSKINQDDVKIYRQTAYQLIDNSYLDVRMLNSLISEMSETISLEGCMKVIGDMVKELNCDFFSICLCDNWISSFSLSDNIVPVQGYTDLMSVPLIWDNGAVTEKKCFSRSNLFPVINSVGGNISYFLPLHFRERSLGYLIIRNSDFPTRSFVCHTLAMSISNSLENISKLSNLNLAINELERLYVMDYLCGIYNRNGFVREAQRMMKESKRHSQKLLISFIDMDGLKLINDQYGHNEGDFALRTMASILNKCCNEKMICARFGGDEFIILAADATEKDIKELEATITKVTENVNKTVKKPYRIEASVGSILSEIDDNSNIFGLVSKADEVMYEQKKRKKTSRYIRKS